MPSTATLPIIFALSDGQRRAAYDAATQRAMAAAHDAAESYKAQHRPDPRANDWLIYHSRGLVCVLVVKHRNTTKSLEVSRDGGMNRFCLSSSEVIAQPESTEDFVLAVISKRFLDWLFKKDPIRNALARQMLGIALPLSATRDWTDAQTETWARLDKLCSDINWRIERARAPQMKRRRELTLTRNGTA